MKDVHDRPRPGDILAWRYRVEEQLGAGGAGVVHAAVDLLHDRPVALKILEPMHTDEESESLRQEFRLLQQLASPHILRVFDLVAAGSRLFFTMERLQGGDLASVADPPDAAVILDHACRGLDHLHRRGLVHADLKPSNLFWVPSEQRLCLMDFGLTQRRDAARRDAPYGTLAYLPPERLSSRSGPDPRQDVFALGAVLYERLTGEAAFARERSEGTLEAIRAGLPAERLASLPDPWRTLLPAMLAFEPASRPENAWEVLAQWNALQRTPAATSDLLSVFVGRRRELQRLRRAVRDLGRGRGAHLHVRGEAGSGRSALLQQARYTLAARGLPCLSCKGPGAHEPMALVHALADFYGRWGAVLPTRVRRAGRWLASWPRILHEAEDAATRHNVLALARGHLQDIAVACPHAIVVDDGHRLDSTSQQILAALADVGRQAGLLLVTAERTEHGDRDDPSLTADEVWTLQGLQPREVEALVTSATSPGRDMQSLAHQLHTATHGRAFDVLDALRFLHRRGVLARRRGGWTTSASTAGDVPALLEAWLVHRLDLEDLPAGGILETLALFSDGATREELETLLAGGATPTQQGLDLGLQRQLLEVTTRLRYRYRHEAVREALARRLPAERARALHRQLARSARGPLAEAHHRLQAGERTAAAAACFLRAAQVCEGRHAHREAIPFLQAALACDLPPAEAEELRVRLARHQVHVGTLESARALLDPLLDERIPVALRRRVLRTHAEIDTRRGDNASALERLQQAVDLQEGDSKNDDGEHEARCQVDVEIVQLLTSMGRYRDAVAQAQQARRRPQRGVSRETAALLLLAEARAAQQEGSYAAAESCGRQALELLRRHPRSRLRARAHTLLGMTCHYRGDYAQAERFHHAAFQEYRALGDLVSLMQAQNNLGMAQMRAGQLQEAVQTLEQSLALKRQLGDLRGQGSGLNNLGNVWERRGDYVRALSCYRHGIRIFRRLQRPRELATLYNNIGEVSFRLGRLHAARRQLERAQEHCATLGTAFIVLAVAANRGLALLELQDAEGARPILERGLEQARDSGIDSMVARFHAWLALAARRTADDVRVHRQAAARALTSCDEESRLDVLLALAESAHPVHDLETARTWAAAAVELAQRTSQPHAEAWGRRLHALACFRMGEWDRAEAELHEAVSQCQRRGFRHELARCYTLLGRLHWDLGLRARAREEFERGFAELEDLDLSVELGLGYLEVARLEGSASPETRESG